MAGRSVFISHSSDDAVLASSLCELLEARQVTCWMAPRDLEVGRPYAEECSRGVEISSALVLLASASAIASGQVLSEIEQAHKRRKPIYTILIGKPKVSRELDYYISRLHWIESQGDSAAGLADTLAKVLAGRQDWSEAASPPSLRRTVLYRRDAFMGSLAATLLVGLVAVAGLAYVGYRSMRGLDSDFRRLGYVSLSALRSGSPGGNEPEVQIRGQVWLLAKELAFRDVTFITITEDASGKVGRADRSSLFVSEQVGGVSQINFAVPATTSRLTACLVMWNPGLGERSRVTQQFAVPAVAEAADGIPLALSSLRSATVSKEDGTLCAATP